MACNAWSTTGLNDDNSLLDEDNEDAVDDGEVPVELDVEVEEPPEVFDVGVVFDGLGEVGTPLV